MPRDPRQETSPIDPPLLPRPGAGPPILGDALAWLDRHVNLEAIEAGRAGRLGLPGLERMRTLLDALGNPELAYQSVHVTGTNGKGSTTRMCAALLGALGLSVGQYTSPHLERLNERLVFGDVEATDEELVGLFGMLGELERFLGSRGTWFELVTAAALSWFADRGADAAVLEVGLGGRYDATNVATAAVSVVTNVELDHTEILGSSREQIAAEKAGIVKEGCTLVLGDQDPPISAIFEREAALVGAAAIWRRGEEFGCDSNRLAIGGRVLDLWTPLGRYQDVFVPMHGAHQGDNAACALAGAQAFALVPLREEVVTAALSNVRIPGRLEVVRRRPLVVLDGAHNVAGAAAVGTALGEDFAAAARVVVVMGCLRGRDPADLLAQLGPGRIAAVVGCRPDSPRALEPEEIVEAARSLGIASEAFASTSEALRRAIAIADPDDLVLVTGSLYVVGAARAALA